MAQPQVRLPVYTPNVVVGVLTAVSRQILFIRTSRIAIALFIYVSILSFVSAFGNFISDGNYIVEKHNIFNQYGVKLGWFWTCLAVGPFIFFAAKAHCNDPERANKHLLRLAVATAGWYVVTTGFHRLLETTSHCDKGKHMSRDVCFKHDGNWHHGIDLSGHLFLMVYSTLILVEEAKAFQYWKQVTDRAKSHKELLEAKQDTQIVTYFFIFMGCLTLFWLQQMTISILYYHIWFDKVVGTLIAICLWYSTYHFVYKTTGIPPPIHRTKKSIN